MRILLAIIMVLIIAGCSKTVEPEIKCYTTDDGTRCFEVYDDGTEKEVT